MGSSSRRLWSEADTKYLTQNFLKIPDEEIAKTLQRTERAVYRKAQKLGLLVERGSIAQALVRIKEALAKEDLSRKELSKKLGVPFASLFYQLSKLMNREEVGSYDRKYTPGLGRKTVVYYLKKVEPIITPRTLENP